MNLSELKVHIDERIEIVKANKFAQLEQAKKTKTREEKAVFLQQSVLSEVTLIQLEEIRDLISKGD